MAEHLFELELEAARAGEPVPGAAHLGRCQDCQARLEALRQADSALQRQPRFEQTLGALRQLPAPPPRWRWLAPVLAAGLAAAAALLLLLPGRAPGPDRTKGAARLAVLAPGFPGRLPHPGERVRLEAGGAGHRFALVYGVEADCQVGLLWPAGAVRAGPLEGVAELGQFEVTPGPVHLWAVFFDAAVPEAPVRSALAEGVAAACRSGRPGTAALPPTLPGEAARAGLLLQVDSGP